MAKQTMYSNPAALGADLADKRFKNELATPNLDDEDAALFSKIGKIAGEKPRGWNALLAGVATGAEYGARTKSTAKKQEALSKYDKVMNYFQEVNHAAAERNKWYETREMAQQKYLPQVMSYAENITKLDPQSQRLMAQNILDGWNRTTGEDYQLASIDGTDPFVMTVSGPQGTQVIDIRDMFSGNEALQNRLAMKTPEYQVQLQEKRQALKDKLAIQQGNLDINKGYLDLEKKKAGIDQGNSQTNKNYGSIPISALKGKGLTSFFNTKNSEINLAQETPIVLGMLEEGKQIIKDHPKLGSSWSNLVGKGDSTRSLLGKDDRAAYEKLRKISSRIAESFIKAKGAAITDSERHTIEKGLFDVSLSPEANQFNIDSVTKELKFAKIKGDFAASQLAQGLISTPQALEKYLQENPNLLTDMTNENEKGDKLYSVRSPDGKIWHNIPESNLDAVIAKGGEVVE